MNITTVLATVSAREFQRNYKSVFAKANKTNEPIMVISNNQLQGVFLSPATFKIYADSRNKQLFWETIASIQAKNKNNNYDDVQKDISRDVKSARKKVYAQTFGRT